MNQMLITQCNGCRVMKPSALTMVSYKPHYHCTIVSATRHAVTWEKEGSLLLSATLRKAEISNFTKTVHSN